MPTMHSTAQNSKQLTMYNVNYPKIYRYALWLYICIFQYWYMFFKRLSCGQ